MSPNHSPNENLVDHFYYKVDLFRFSLLSEKSSAILQNHPGILSFKILPVLALFPRFQPRLLGLRLLVTSCFHSLADCKEGKNDVCHPQGEAISTHFKTADKSLFSLASLLTPASLEVSLPSRPSRGSFISRLSLRPSRISRKLDRSSLWLLIRELDPLSWEFGAELTL